MGQSRVKFVVALYRYCQVPVVPQHIVLSQLLRPEVYRTLENSVLQGLDDRISLVCVGI